MYYSPLRYPGGKGKVLSFMKEYINLNSFNTPVYVEPYAGGAAVALGLLIEGFVSDIHINDSDTGIYSFWLSVLNDADNLILKIQKAKLNINEWKKQKNIYNNQHYYSDLEVGFATFYLNRCNYSGVIKGGPIGGMAQSGNWKLDARFNKQELIKRIVKIAEYSSKIHLYNCDTFDLLSNNKKKYKNALLYLDPPYFNKGYQLYKNHYKIDDHIKIANLVETLEGNWIVSYDNVPEIVDLYKFAESKEFNISYSAGKNKSGKEIMFFPKNSIIPLKVIC